MALLKNLLVFNRIQTTSYQHVTLFLTTHSLIHLTYLDARINDVKARRSPSSGPQEPRRAFNKRSVLGQNYRHAEKNYLKVDTHYLFSSPGIQHRKYVQSALREVVHLLLLKTPNYCSYCSGSLKPNYRTWQRPTDIAKLLQLALPN